MVFIPCIRRMYRYYIHRRPVIYRYYIRRRPRYILIPYCNPTYQLCILTHRIDHMYPLNIDTFVPITSIHQCIITIAQTFVIHRLCIVPGTHTHMLYLPAHLLCVLILYVHYSWPLNEAGVRGANRPTQLKICVTLDSLQT